MIKILLAGCSGKMGRTVANLAAADPNFEVVGGIDKVTTGYSFPVFANAADCNVKADVMIDFSHPSMFSSLLEFCVNSKLPLVCGTTGLDQSQHDSMKQAAKSIPVFYATNMSWGVFILNKLVKQATQYLYPGWDIEIIEAHHNAKVDAPSGTAVTLLKNVQAAAGELQPVYNRHDVSQKRNPMEIGMHSLRGGTIVGDHEVVFAGFNEVIKISHSAQSKEIFAGGSLKAAAFMKGKAAGYYTMDNLVSD